MLLRWILLPLLLSTLALGKPKFELGLGVGSLYYPDYIGSSSTQLLTLPFPFIRYNGKYFKIDKDGINGKLFGIDGLRVDLSVSGSLPTSSTNSVVREGMPNLDFTAEIGPKLVYNIYEHGVALLEFEFPIRAVLSSDFKNVGYQGIVSNPQLKYSLKYQKIEWTLRTGVIFSNQQYNNYFYEVKEKYATPTRVAYHPNAGFGGIRNRIGVVYRTGNWWSGAYISHYNISKAVFHNSPLVERNSAIYTGVALAYVFYTQD